MPPDMCVQVLRARMLDKAAMDEAINQVGGQRIGNREYVVDVHYPSARDNKHHNAHGEQTYGTQAQLALSF